MKNIKVTKNGPYIIGGNVPLQEEIIKYDADGVPEKWEITKTYSPPEPYALCRCGQSKNPPFCDGTHQEINFDGTEQMPEKFIAMAEVFHGDELELHDAGKLCAGAGFCHRHGGVWDLIKENDFKELATEIVNQCPAGRLALKNREHKLTPIISITPGPLWVKGNIPIVSADDKQYEPRNRVTLCSCGKSRNKPFCDGSHLS